MAQSVFIQLTTAGASTGPFDLYSNADGYVTAFETGVAKASLVAGYVSSVVPDAATAIRVMSTGSCTNFLDVIISGVTTTTTTTTTPYPYNLAFDWTAALSETVTAITVNASTPTLISGTDVPFSSDTHYYDAATGATQTLAVTMTVGVAGQKIRLVDSDGVPQCQDVNSSGTYTFTNVSINNSNPCFVYGEDGTC